jgi:HPt (histidine-containing phosphotransfer) domain-containing protein
MSDAAIVVLVDADLEDLLPGFMQRRHADVESLRAALSSGDLERVRVTGHSLKGTAGGYGFAGLSEIGARIESAAREGDTPAIAEQIAHMADYLARVEIRFR